MDPAVIIYENLIHNIGEGLVKFALEAGRAAVWALVFYVAAKRFMKKL